MPSNRDRPTAVRAEPTIHQATRSYERWLGTQLRLCRGDLGHKHSLMRDSAFAFLRGSFYHWAREWKTWCPELADAPVVLAVGDMHIENFGTWRDAEGRLVWGVNDFDEAWPLPYTNDLLRLATSVQLARRERGLSLGGEAVVSAILTGYAAGMEAGGGPFVLAERHDALRAMALARLRDAGEFWEKLASSKPLAGGRGGSAVRVLRRALPAGAIDVRLSRRRAGVGSLGRERIAAVAAWRGGLVAREAKAMAPSACAWATGRSGPRRRWHRRLLRHALRCPDPFARLQGSWILRRLAPDCSRIELTELAEAGGERRLLEAMGWELANVHLAEGGRRAILQDLYRREPDWLHDAMRRAAREVRRAYAVWSEG